MKRIETYIVDSFTDESFKGNPAGVCLMQEVLTNKKMLIKSKAQIILKGELKI